MMKRNQVNFLKSLWIFPVLFVLFSFPRDFRPCSLRQEGGRGRSGHSGKPRRRQDHCGGGHRECLPSSTDQLNISWQKLKDFCWGGPNIVPRQEWIKSGLVFHSPEQTNAYGLNTTKGATKAFQIVLGMVTSRTLIIIISKDSFLFDFSSRYWLEM